MIRSISASLLLGGCTFLSWAQTPTSQSLSSQSSASEQSSGHPDHSSESAPDAGKAASPAQTTPEVPAQNKNAVFDQFKDFSAIVIGGPLPGMSAERFIYRSGNLMRMQGDDTAPKYLITDLVKLQSYSISSRTCLRETIPYKLSFPFMLVQPGVTYEHIPVGQEIVDGHPSHVEDLMIHKPKDPTVLHFRLYEADDLQGFPIKIENRREHAYPWVIHYKNVKLGPQDPTLFIYPSNCGSMEGFTKVGSGSKAGNSKTGSTPKPQ